MIRASIALFLLLSLATAADEAKPPRFEKEIAAFEQADLTAPPTPGTIEFIGSSTFRLWDTLQADMAPLPVFNRAFGGSQVQDVLRVAPRIVIPYKPKVIVYFCGGNNLTTPETAKPQVVVAGFTDFLALVRKELPEVRVVFMSINPCPKRFAAWPQVAEANATVKAMCATDDKLLYAETAPFFFADETTLKSDLYKADGVHPNAKGYVGITERLKPVVEQAWQAANAKAEP